MQLTTSWRNCGSNLRLSSINCFYQIENCWHKAYDVLVDILKMEVLGIEIPVRLLYEKIELEELED
jgi:hypothetical protein